MEFPIERLPMPIELNVVPRRKFFVVTSAYSNADRTEITVIIEIKNGLRAKHKLNLSFELDQELLCKTNLRTTLYKACVQAQNRLETATNKLMRSVLESRRKFDPASIGVKGDCITYLSRGFAGLAIKV